MTLFYVSGSIFFTVGSVMMIIACIKDTKEGLDRAARNKEYRKKQK